MPFTTKALEQQVRKRKDASRRDIKLLMVYDVAIAILILCVVLAAPLVYGPLVGSTST